MGSRFLTIGGFEPSGHDAIAEAVIETGRARGLDVEYLQWRDRIDLSSHPIFVSHRAAAARGVPELAGMLDESWIADSLFEDLGHLIPRGFDGYVSVHPWSSVICARALEAAQDASSVLVDYYSEFGAFPAVVHSRIDAYCGGGAMRPFEPSVRRRFHEIGVAVAKRFVSCVTDKKIPTLVVSGGANGWAIPSLAQPARMLVDFLKPTNVALLAPTPAARELWKSESVTGQIVEGTKDISHLLRSANWYLTKGGGTAVAEGLAAGCSVFVARSGIFWEDEAAHALAAERAVAVVGGGFGVQQPDDRAVGLVRERVLGATSALWNLIESGNFLRSMESELSVTDGLAGSITQEDMTTLPHTTRRLAQRLRSWAAVSTTHGNANDSRRIEAATPPPLGKPWS